MLFRSRLPCRAFDPVLGIVSGVWAYYLYENRANRPAGHTLPELVQRKWSMRSAKKDADRLEDEGWKELEAEVSKMGGK